MFYCVAECRAVDQFLMKEHPKGGSRMTKVLSTRLLGLERLPERGAHTAKRKVDCSPSWIVDSIVAELHGSRQ